MVTTEKSTASKSCTAAWMSEANVGHEKKQPELPSMKY